MSVDVVTFGCRLNAYESEVIRRHAEAAGLGDTVVVNTCAVTAEAVRQARQAIRKAARAAGRENRRHRLRRADRAGNIRRHGGGRPRPRQRREDAPGRLGRYAHGLPAHAGFRRGGGKGSRQRYHERARNGAAPDRHFRRTRARGRAGAERLRSPLHLLRHPLWPRQFALGADGRGGGAGAQAHRARLSRSRAHRRRSHQLRLTASRRAETRHPGEADPQARARIWRGCGSPRSTRWRPTAICSTRLPTTIG